MTMGSTDVQRDASNGISVLISGAGVGGLTSALEFFRRGCDVRVLERAKESLTTGTNPILSTFSETLEY